MKSICTVYRLPWNEYRHELTEDWFQTRVELFRFRTDLEGEKAAEEAFHITNAPEEILTEQQKEILKENSFKGPCLSVGDVVRVSSSSRPPGTHPDYYLCKSQGWEKFDGKVIQLLKHLSW